jgi:hypothetical protein
MPIVLHELNNATQFLAMLHNVISQDPESEVLEKSAPDLSLTAGGVDDLGLMMAILSTASGTDLLMERRSERGVAVVASATIKLIRKSGRDVHLEGISEPLAVAPEGQGWELPWAMSASWWIAASELTDDESLTIKIDESGWSSTTGGSERMRAHADAVGECLPGLQGEVTGAAWRFSLPARWLADARS